MREWRKSNPLSEEQKRKDIARSYANTYLQRGKLEKQPCIHCGAIDSQMHHPDYSRPLEVVWLCKDCHQKHHKD
jgi:hypothetical protein